MNTTTEKQIEAALQKAEGRYSLEMYEILGELRQWIVPGEVSENDDMIAARILAAEVRRLRKELNNLIDYHEDMGREHDH